MAYSAALICFILSLNVLKTGASVTPSFPIGGLFNEETLDLSKNAFQNICQMGDSREYHGRVFYPNVLDSFSTTLQMCKNTSDSSGSVVALIDARPTKGICDYTCTLCNRLNISYLSVGWQPSKTHAEDLFTFSYYPPPELISKAYATLIKEQQWHKLAIFYEDEGMFIRLQEVINTWRQELEPIVYRKLDPNGDNRQTFKRVIKELRISTHILDCEVEHISKYVKEIIAVEKSTQYQSFILTNLDSHTYRFDFEDFLANVSTMYMTMKNDDKWLDSGFNPIQGIKMETALTADALNHLKKAIRSLIAGNFSDEDFMRRLQYQNFENPPPICFAAEKVSEYSDKAWPLGKDFREALLRTRIPEGFTGNIEFDEYGKRTNVRFYYSDKLNDKGEFVYTGYWDSTKDVIYKENDSADDRLVKIPQGVLRVVSKIEKPYMYYKKLENGTQVLNGYAVDLIHKMLEIINVKKKNGTKLVPEFHIAYGIGKPIEGTKKWDGIIGDLMNHDADLGICDLTITSDRNNVVDFSIPFMTTGIAIMFRKEDPEEPDMFSFIKPLSLDVWLYLATTYIVVSVVLLICARMSQMDWVNPHPCNQNPENLQNIWSLYNCMWLTMGTIMTQGCDILPRGIGSRWITGMWWFFAMIITASYTANMSTFISNKRRTNDIEDVNDLADQHTISYGAVFNSSTYYFFKNSNESLHQKIWAAMESAKPTVFEKSNDLAKDRVLRSKRNYAFFMESTAIKYYTERYCSLKMVGSELDSKEYGIAMPKKSPQKGLIDAALLTLQENGYMSELREKWWHREDNEARVKDPCEKETKSDDSLKMKNTSGIFLVLGTGGVLGLIVAAIDFLMHAHEISVLEKVTFKEAIMSEWRASLDPRLLQKPVAPPRSTPTSTSPSLQGARSRSRAVSVLKAATSFINFDQIY